MVSLEGLKCTSMRLNFVKYKGREREYKREYSQKWRDGNPERANELARLSYHRRMQDPDKAEQIRKRKAKRYQENKEKLEYRIGHIGRGKRVPIATRRLLITRANGLCERRHLGECKGTLRCHHIEDPEDHSLANLLLVCNRHHKQEDEDQPRNELGQFISSGSNLAPGMNR